MCFWRFVSYLRQTMWHFYVVSFWFIMLLRINIDTTNCRKTTIFIHISISVSQLKYFEKDIMYVSNIIWHCGQKIQRLFVRHNDTCMCVRYRKSWCNLVNAIYDNRRSVEEDICFHVTFGMCHYDANLLFPFEVIF